MKRRMLVYGNCQANWLANTLAQTAAVAAEYEIIYLTDYAEVAPEHPCHEAGFFATVDDAVWQTAANCRPPAFREGLRADCRQIRFPTLWLKLLWPTYAVDPRNQPEPDFPWGRYPYGDRLAMKLLAAGVTPEDLPKRYMETDLNEIVNLDRYSEMVRAELANNDRQSDVSIGPYIEATFRERKLFGTVNHPTYRVLHRIYEGVLGVLAAGRTMLPLPEPVHAADVLGAEEVPLHPQIITHFKLRWAVPGMKWQYRSAFWDLTEYLHAYARFTPVLVDSLPSVAFARAQQASALQDYPEAKRILLAASISFPKETVFFRYLAVLMRRRNELVEAEQVIRYAITMHPGVSALLCDLGEILRLRGFPGEAAQCLTEALRIAPANPDARRQLVALVGVPV